eukprot:338068-Pleurochrysis_carterae.AAC.1
MGASGPLRLTSSQEELIAYRTIHMPYRSAKLLPYLTLYMHRCGCTDSADCPAGEKSSGQVFCYLQFT